MFDLLAENLGTLLVLAIIATVSALIVIKMVKNKRAGKSSCSCGCSSCPMNGTCRPGSK